MDVLDRLMAKVETSPSGCWEWRAAMFANGYGQFRHKGQNVKAHRIAYELLVGLIPEGLTIDHLCSNKRCVNPDHLEPVTQLENTRRATARKTECASGHPWVEENIYTDRRGWNRCLVCHRDRSREDARRRRAEKAVSCGVSPV